MKLHYTKLGPDSEERLGHKPLFILHGLFGMSDNWLTVGKKLVEFFTVYLIDLRNFGQSPHSDEWTYPAMAEDIYDLLTSAEEHRIEKIILLGHSMGGKVAMQFASIHPEKLEKLIIVDIAPKNYPDNQFDFIEKLPSVPLSEMKTRKEAEAHLTAIIKDPATVQLLLKNIQWNGQGKLEWKFNLKVIAENQDKIGKTFSLAEKPITTSTLFIRGEKSNYISDSDFPEIKKWFPNSELKIIEGAGHWVHADKPMEFASCVEKFSH